MGTAKPIVRCVFSSADPAVGARGGVLSQPANHNGKKAQRNAGLFAFLFFELTRNANFDRLFEAQDTVGIVVKDLF